MDKFGKRSQTPRISVSRSLQACILYSFSNFILATTSLSTFCKRAQENTKCDGTSHQHHHPVIVVKRSKPSLTYFQEMHCIRVAKTTPYMWTPPLRVSWEDTTCRRPSGTPGWGDYWVHPPIWWTSLKVKLELKYVSSRLTGKKTIFSSDGSPLVW